jgi:hypothetical protein
MFVVSFTALCLTLCASSYSLERKQQPATKQLGDKQRKRKFEKVKEKPRTFYGSKAPKNCLPLRKEL